MTLHVAGIWSYRRQDWLGSWIDPSCPKSHNVFKTRRLGLRPERRDRKSVPPWEAHGFILSNEQSWILQIETLTGPWVAWGFYQPLRSYLNPCAAPPSYCLLTLSLTHRIVRTWSNGTRSHGCVLSFWFPFKFTACLCEKSPGALTKVVIILSIN